MRVVSFLIFSLLLSGCASKGSIPPLKGEVFQHVAGKWDSVSNPNFCKSGTDIELIRFSSDNRIANFHRPIPPLDKTGSPVTDYEYLVLYNDHNSITMMVTDEERSTPNGDRFVWVLILEGKNKFTWRATHWGKEYRTKLTMGRCP